MNGLYVRVAGAGDIVRQRRLLGRFWAAPSTSPLGSTMLRSIATIAAAALCVTDIVKAAPPPPGWEHFPAQPMTYKDPRTSIILYVETDGRHVAAINADGTLLWVRDPFKGSRACPAEQAIPVIASLKAQPSTASLAEYLGRFGFEAGDQLIEIMFASNYFGYLDERTGDFVCIGIN